MSALLTWLDSHYFVTFVAEYMAVALYVFLSPKRLRGWKLGAGLSIAALVLGAVLWSSQVFMYRYASMGRMVIGGFVTLNTQAMIFGRLAVYTSLMWAALYLLGGCSRRKTTYVTVRALLLAEFDWSLATEMADPLPDGLTGLRLLVIFAAVLGTNLLVYLLEKHQSTGIYDTSVTIHETAIALCVCAIAILITTFFSSPSDAIFGTGRQVSHLLVDFLAFMVIFQYRLWAANLQKQQELAIIHHAMKLQREQYMRTQESMESFQRKVHDTKHLVALLRMEGEAAQDIRRRWIVEMEKDIHIYEAMQNTGRYLKGVRARFHLPNHSPYLHTGSHTGPQWFQALKAGFPRHLQWRRLDFPEFPSPAFPRPRSPAPSSNP